LDRRLSIRPATATGGAGATPKGGASSRSRGSNRRSGDQESSFL
jgi:hypothetical protein